MKQLRLGFRKGDAIAIGAVVLLAVALVVAFLPTAQAPANGVVQVYREGKLLRELPLNGDTTYAISGAYTNTLQIRQGKVAIIHSDCPGEDCVHTGWISTPGRSIVCLPNRVEIRITGSGDVDFVVG